MGRLVVVEDQATDADAAHVGVMFVGHVERAVEPVAAYAVEAATWGLDSRCVALVPVEVDAQRGVPLRC